MPRKILATNVFDTAIDRMCKLYEGGHRIVVSFSAGKDSTCCLEVCIIAATMTNRLPVEVVLQDEEVAYPGTYEFAVRTAQRPEVDFNWLVMNQPVINIFNRRDPYFWVFDPKLAPEDWVRQPPDFAKQVNELDITRMTIPDRFPPAPGKTLFAVIGLRTSESRGRLYGLHSSGGYLTGPNKYGVRNARPIYDWTDSDVWKGIKDNRWDYNKAYDVLFALGTKPKGLRIGPPTMTIAGVGQLQRAMQAWPQWFTKVCTRLPGVRTAAQFGVRAVSPARKLGESWEQCFKRECIADAPAPFIAARAQKCMDHMLSTHRHHSTSPFPEVTPCYTCFGNLGCWKSLATTLYNGDPFSLKTTGILPYVEPEFFRAGAGTWGDGKPCW